MSSIETTEDGRASARAVLGRPDTAVQLLPIALVRVGGERFEWLESLDSQAVQSLLDELASARARLGELSATLVDALYTLLREHPESRAAVLRIKRDVFNLREVAPQELQRVRSLAPDPLPRILDDYGACRDSIRELIERGTSSWTALRGELRARLRLALASESLRRGLALTSPAVHRELQRLDNAPVEASGKRDKDLERTLIKYLARTCSKTSPLSAFTTLARGVLQRGQSGQMHAQGEHRCRSRVRLNPCLFAELEQLLVRSAVAWRRLVLFANPTLKSSGATYAWYVELERKGAFRSLSADPVLDRIWNATSAPAGIVSTELVDSLLEGVDATRERIQQHLQRLVECGFLELRLRTSGGNPDWPRHLQEELAQAGEPLLTELASALAELLELAGRLESASSQQRGEIVEAGHARRDAALDALQGVSSRRPSSSSEATPDAEGAALEPRALFLEDVACEQVFHFRESDMARLASSIERLVEGSRGLDKRAWDCRSQWEWFLSNYGPNPVEFLRFHEDLSRAGGSAAITPSLDQDDASERWLSSFRQFAAERIQASRATFDFDAEDLRAVARACGRDSAPSRSETQYRAAFLQLRCAERGAAPLPTKAVLNGVVAGHGKSWGRLLHLFEERVTEAIRCWNTPGPGEPLLAEACDPSCYGANLHPPLVACELWAPGAHHRLDPERRLSPRDLEVWPDPTVERLRLRHRSTGREIHVLDLGFQRRTARSALFQFMTGFSPVGEVELQPLLRAIYESVSRSVVAEVRRDEQVVEFPRVTFESAIVLHRRAWYVPRARLPSMLAGESEWSLAQRLDAWRRELGLPWNVFVRSDPHWIGKAMGSEPRGRDAHKPQHVRFGSPLFLPLFTSVARGVRELLEVQEMLPAPEELVGFDGERRVTEVVLEWKAA
jgi:hypothetical protein